MSSTTITVMRGRWIHPRVVVATSTSIVASLPGIPREVVTRVNAEVNRALRLADVRERLTGIAAEVLGGSPEDVNALIRADYDRYGRVARENKIKAD